VFLLQKLTPTVGLFQTIRRARPFYGLGGAQEECECVAVALNELARQRHAKLIAAENEKRLDNLARWDRERDERIQALEKTLRGLANSDC
jgi:hypothetical protein